MFEVNSNPKVLIVAPEYPYPADDGHKVRNYNLFNQFSSGFRLELLCFGNPDLLKNKTNPANQLGPCFENIDMISPNTLKPLEKLNGIAKLKNIIYPLELSIGIPGYSHELETAVYQKISSRSYDLIYFSGFSSFLYYRPEAHYIPFIVDIIDSLVLYLKSYFQKHRSLKTLVDYIWARRYEKIHFPKAKNMIFVSPVDCKLVAPKCPHSRIWVVPNGVDDEYYKSHTMPAHSNYKLLFTGVMDYHPNNDSIIYFIKSIYPLVKAKIPNATLTIAGKNPTAELLAICSDNPDIKVTGSVSDMRPYFEDASVYVAPIIAGAGLKNKILEAWAMLKPVVSTTIGGNGLEAVDGENLLFADTPTVFAEKVVTLLENPDLRTKLASNGRKTVEQHYSWKSQSDKLGEIFKEVLER